MFFLNVRKLSELGRLGSNLFHSEIVDGKKEFLKKIYFDLKMGKLIHNEMNATQFKS